MPANKTEKKENEMKLEEAMRRLETVVASLDADGVDLESALALYEEGVRLVRICNEKLTDAERQVKVLKMSSEGEITEENFDTKEN